MKCLRLKMILNKNLYEGKEMTEQNEKKKREEKTVSFLLA